MKDAKIALAVGAFAFMALAATPALPQGFPAYDDVGYRAILAKDWAAAEKQLVAGLEKNPNNVYRQLNLAWVYVQMDRKGEAAAIYRRILTSEQDRTAQLPSRQSRSVKALAERGLALVETR
jgi:Tfp pilus assembly protein PilF